MQEAFKWYTKAAEQGYAEAQFCLAECYITGIGTERNWERAIDWYRKAAEQGHAEAQHLLEILTK